MARTNKPGKDASGGGGIFFSFCLLELTVRLLRSAEWCLGLMKGFCLIMSDAELLMGFILKAIMSQVLNYIMSISIVFSGSNRACRLS
jgi:hypothetical protein